MRLGSNPPARSVSVARLLASVAFLASSLPALSQSALPSGAAVVGGSASIASSATSVLVTQSSPNAIINWRSFSVGAGNAVRFENGSGATLNRVTGFSASQIDGSLTASGSLYLVNPNGITIGPSGNVVTGGSFVASTHDVANAAFMAGGEMTFKGTSRASVINYGAIGSLGGDVALIARMVENAGTISAPQGTAVLAAGYEILVRDGALSDGKFVVKLGGADTEAKTRGIIKAAEVELKANGGNVYALAGNTGSLTKATGVSTRGGRVFLTAGDGGTVTVTQKVSAKRANGQGGAIKVSGGKVKVSGELDARGERASGGSVIVTGKDIALTSGALLDASGTTGGVVLVGGDYQGGKEAASNYVAQDIATAETTTVDAGAVIRADGSAGAGGQVVVWSDAATRFAGAISATGAGMGPGGDAEVSGKAYLAFTGTANLTSTSGVFGTLLLDPYNLTISDSPNSSVSALPNVSATGDDSVLNVTLLQNALSSANVTITTGTSSSPGDQEGNIVVATAVSWSADTILTLSAAGNVIFSAAVTATGESAGLAIEYGTGKDYIVNAPITLSGGSATLQIGATGALQSYTLIHSMADLDAIDTTGLSGRYALAKGLSASGTVYTNALVTGSFTGTFTGLGNTISNLVIDAPTIDNVGLFAKANYGSTLRDINLFDGSVTGNGSVGPLAGSAAGKVSNVSSNLTVVGSSSFVGGLVGLNSGGGGGAGIWDSSATGSVSGVDYVGGIAGNSQASITRSYATGAVNGRDYVGGISGITGDTVSETYATGAVTATGDYVGGLIGMNGAAVQNSYATGAVRGGSNTGGLVGTNYGLIQTSYALGSVAGTTGVGGLVGADESATINTTYATGAVTGTSGVGGLVGTSGQWSSISSSYWDKDTTGQAHSSGSDDSFGLTTAQARSAASYSGWDFSTVWYQSADMRPILRAEAASAVNGVITIANLHQLALVGLNLSASYVLGADIDASATAGTTASDIWGAGGWVPVGSSSVAFTGTFDGDDHVISGLVINRANTDDVGLFSYAGASSTIRDVGLVDLSVTGSNYVGGLVGQNSGSITGSSVTGAVTGGGFSVGGLAGSSSGVISASYATATVQAAGYAGGLVGESNSTTISLSYATGSVSSNERTGGLVGSMSGGSITQSYASGAVSGGESTGGLVGTLDGGSIEQSYALGSVTGRDSKVGGLVGEAAQGTISQAYASGAVSAAGSGADLSTFGGLIGGNGGVTITSSYWDKDTTGQAHSSGSDDSFGLTTAQARSAASYSGWDFSTVWYQSADMRPILRAEAASAVNGVITISNLHQLALVGLNLSGSYVLGADIDASATAGTTASDIWGAGGWVPVGSSSVAFTGTFDGDDHVISGLVINRANTDDVGLFSYTGAASTIRDIGLDDLSVTGSNYVGGLVGQNSGSITGSSVTGAVTGGGFSVGGLAGSSSGVISASYATATVQAAGYAGGLVGESNSTTISLSYATGSVSSNERTGGLVGSMSGGSITQSYASGAVSGGESTGGLVGTLDGGSIEQSYALGSVTGRDSKVGGLVGEAAQGSIAQSYASGAVSGGEVTGGLVGSNSVSITASFWNTETTGQDSAFGANPTSGATGLTTAQFQNTADFIALAQAEGWDFSTVWVPPSDGYYPEFYALSPVVWVNSTTSTSTYGDSTATVTAATGIGGPASYVFGSAGDSVTLTGGTIAVDPTTNAGTQTVALTSQNGSATSTDGVQYRVFYYGTGTATIAQATLTVTADDGSMVYGDAAPTLGYTTSGWKNGQTGALLTGVSVTTDATSLSNVGTGYTSTAADGTLSGAATGNYALSYVTGGVAVTQATLTVTADDGSMVYGDAVPTLGYTTSGWKNGQTGALLTGVSVTTDATSLSNVGTGYTSTAADGTLSGAATGNYTLSYVTGSVAVTQATLTVTADDGSMVYGDAVPTLGYTTSGWKNGQTGALLTGVSVTTDATSTSNVGTGYTSTATDGTLSGGATGNYALSYVQGGVAVTQATLTVTADDGSMVYGDAAPTLGYQVTSGALVNGDTLSGALATTASATSNVGRYAITQGTLTASLNYTLTYVGANVTVGQRGVTVVADNQSMISGAALPSLTYTLASGSLVNGDSFSGVLSTTAGQGSPVGLYPILQGSLALSSNYQLTYVPGALAILASPQQEAVVPASLFVPQPPADQWVVTTDTVLLIVASEDGGSSEGSDSESSAAAGSGCDGSASTACANQPPPENRSFGRWLTFRIQ